MAAKNPQSSSSSPVSNFRMLVSHEPEPAKLGTRAERYIGNPSTCMLRVRQFAEIIVVAQVGIYTDSNGTQIDLPRRLESSENLSLEPARVFRNIHRLCNDANHNPPGTHGDALSALKMDWALAMWFQRASIDPACRSGPFIPPAPPDDTSEAIAREPARLKSELDEAIRRGHDAHGTLEETRLKLIQSEEEKLTLERLAQKSKLEKASINKRHLALQESSQENPAVTINAQKLLKLASSALEHDEVATRTTIDQQLRDVGWEDESTSLRHGLGMHPEQRCNMVIAEWPTAIRRADYIVFVGLSPVAVVEAKKSSLTVSEAIKQAKRYSNGFRYVDGTSAAEGQPRS